MNDLTKKYSKATIIIHWLSALLIIALFPLGKYMSGLEPEAKMGLIKIHAISGMLVLILTLVRTFVFFKHKRPEDIKTGSKFNDKLSIWIHNIFYFIIIGICVSGVATMILGGYGNALTANDSTLIMESSEIGPLKPHGLMALIMMLLLVMHIVGVIKHYVIKKENTLKRIS